MRTEGDGFVLEIQTYKYIGRDAEGYLIDEKRTVQFSQSELSALFGAETMSAIRSKINAAFGV